jgi:hypothetical protein
MKYAVEMGSGAMISIPCSIKISSAIQRLIEGIHRRHDDRISLLSFFQNMESRLKLFRPRISCMLRLEICLRR